VHGIIVGMAALHLKRTVAPFFSLFFFRYLSLHRIVQNKKKFFFFFFFFFFFLPLLLLQLLLLLLLFLLVWEVITLGKCLS